MTDVDRRTSLMLLGAGAASLLASWPAAARAAAPAVILFDSRFADAVHEAAAWGRNGALTIDTRKSDIGHAWRGAIADRMGQGSAAIVGITLYADQMISELMGREYGLKLAHLQRARVSPGGATLLRWVLA